VLSSGDVVAALLASAAIPAVFPTVTIGGRPLMDGGIASNTPIAAAVALGATRIIVLPTGTSCALQAPPRGAVAMALHALNLLSMRQLLADIDRFAGRCELTVVPPLCPMATHAYDFSRTQDLIRRAEQSTHDWLRDGSPGTNPAWALLPHRHDRIDPQPCGPVATAQP
jgi:NTE family protein